MMRARAARHVRRGGADRRAVEYLREGIGFNRFHTTAMCSPTRASLLTGRNHHRIGNGQIAELANDWDGYSGEIPKSSALGAEVLKHYGYATAAFGKWHNTPAIETTTAGPFHNWPSEIGFEYFYGFLAGRPRSTSRISFATRQACCRPGRRRRATTSARTWPTTRSPGCTGTRPSSRTSHSSCTGRADASTPLTTSGRSGPTGMRVKFDDGWDAYRERVFERAKELGWIPPTPSSLRGSADAGVGGRRRGGATVPSPAHGGGGRIRRARRCPGRPHRRRDRSPRAAARTRWCSTSGATTGRRGRARTARSASCWPRTAFRRRLDMHIKALRRARWPRRARLAQGRQPVPRRVGLGRQHALQGDEAAGLSFRRNPQSDGRLAGRQRSVPTRRPRPSSTTATTSCRRSTRSLGSRRRASSTASAGSDRRRELRVRLRRRPTRPDACGHNISRSWAAERIYHDDWMASAFGPRLPWVPGLPPGIKDWTPDQDQWRALQPRSRTGPKPTTSPPDPEKLAQMKEKFAIEAARNSVFPIGGGLWIPIFHPELRISTPYREWNFARDIIRMPEFCAPALGNRGNLVTIDAEIPENASGVLYALGEPSGGLTVLHRRGVLCYEYNLFILMRTKIRSEQRVPAGERKDRDLNRVRRAQAGRPAEHHDERQRRPARRTAWCRSARRCCSPPTTASTSASATAAASRSTTTTAPPFHSTARSRTSTSATPPRTHES